MLLSQISCHTLDLKTNQNDPNVLLLLFCECFFFFFSTWCFNVLRNKCQITNQTGTKASEEFILTYNAAVIRSQLPDPVVAVFIHLFEHVFYGHCGCFSVRNGWSSVFFDVSTQTGFLG